MGAVVAPAASPLIHQHKSLLLQTPKPNLKPHRSSTEASSTFQPLLPHPATSSGFAAAIDSCNSYHLGCQIHANAIKHAYCGSQEFLDTRLIFMYGRCSNLQNSFQLFVKMCQRTIHSWVGILTVCVDHELCEETLHLFLQLQIEGIELDFFVFPVVLKACASLGAVEVGEAVHGFVLKTGFLSNTYVANALVDMYGKCGLLDEAMKVLEGMPEKDCVSWNSVITGLVANGLVFEAVDVLESMRSSYAVEPNLVSWSSAIGGLAQSGHDGEALGLLRQMLDYGVKPNAQTLASILPCCGRLQELDLGKEIHGYVVRHELMSNSFTVNGLIDVYRRCGDMDSAQELFLRFSVRSSVSYNTMIVGYCENGELDKAKATFDHMELDGVKRDTISWNSLISGYKNNGKFEEGLKLFQEMLAEDGVQADSFTLGSILACCASLTALEMGKEMHSYAIARNLHSNPFVGGALVEMYSRCQDLMSAELVFFHISGRDTTTWNVLISNYARADRMSHTQELIALMERDGFDPNIYTWNGIIAGCLDNERHELALQMLSVLQARELRPDIFTIGMLLPVCSRLASIEQGKQVHAYSIRCCYETDVHIGAALVDMYAKCGSIKLAKLAFRRISQQNLVSLNAMLAGFAMHGLMEQGIALFHQMLEDEVRPDAITFISVLSLCVHGGSSEEGLHYFNMMGSYSIKPELKHYTCMVDLFSRAGKLAEAYRLIRNMPMEPDAVIWGALLGGCVVHCNVELGEIAANRLLELEQGNAGNYVMLANLYSRAGKHEDLARVRRLIGERGMHKSPGCSWIEHKNQVHIFLANYRSHKQTSEIYATLEALDSHMRLVSDFL